MERLSLEPIPCRDLGFAHGACRYDLAESWGAQSCVNGGEAGMIENVVGRQAQLQALHLFHLNALGDCHVEINGVRTNYDIAAGIAERPGRGSEGSRVKPVQDVRIAGLDGLSGNHIGAMRAGDAAPDICGITEDAG